MKRPVGRPRKPLNETTLEELAAIQCSYAEMAAVLKVDASTLTRNYAQVIERGRERGKQSLKRAQYKLAMSGNATMLIWLGKQHLGQKDRQDHELTGAGGIPLIPSTVKLELVRAG